jgi:hypothetical protein
MECITPKGNHLICIGYKYSASKVLVFLGTRNAGSTKPGEPYIARFPDANGNVAQRSVPRPSVISKYFNDSNVIDSHNHARQYELALEKRWVTHDCFFRVASTLIGMTVTDAWRAYKHAMPLKRSDITIKEFADRLAYDCIHNTYSDVTGFNGYLAVDSVPAAIGGRQSDVSSVTAFTTATAATVALEHPFRSNPELEPDKGDGKKPRAIRRVCKAIGCKKTYHKMCFHRDCLNHQYMAPKGLVCGVFYCPEHYYMHYDAIMRGTGV